VAATNQVLEAGISACGPGKHFKGIGKAIYDLTRYSKFSISPQFTGHGIGTVFHRPPWILHHRTFQSPVFLGCWLPILVLVNDEPGVMMPGNCFTIEVRVVVVCLSVVLILITLRRSLV
jgi:methionyl aminopeptidase